MENSPLSRLSPELRNQIYHLALYERRPVAITPNRTMEPSLLKTCKQIRNEAELLFYAINHFTAIITFSPSQHLVYWLGQGPKQKLALIRSLTVRYERPGHGFHPGGIARTANAVHYATFATRFALHNCTFGDRPIASVVRFFSNSAPDNVRMMETVKLGRVPLRLHVEATMLMMTAAFGDDAWTAVDVLDGPEHKRLEDVLHKDMQARL
ncbi:hypothetical protein LTR08_006156 [Meristemomyces frigidus]|nr:hypothetical protein LTR08_006156 [Meristemomyces frigidus]